MDKLNEIRQRTGGRGYGARSPVVLSSRDWPAREIYVLVAIWADSGQPAVKLRGGFWLTLQDDGDVSVLLGADLEALKTEKQASGRIHQLGREGILTACASANVVRFDRLERFLRPSWKRYYTRQRFPMLRGVRGKVKGYFVRPRRKWQRV